MRLIVWIALGWFGVSFFSAISARIGLFHLLPDAAVVIITFLAIRKEPYYVTMAAMVFGYLLGRQSGATLGLHETALILMCGSIVMMSTQLWGDGAPFFALLAGWGLASYHLCLALLTWLLQGHVGFISWPVLVLLPNVILTTILAFLTYPLLHRLDLRMSARKETMGGWR